MTARPLPPGHVRPASPPPGERDEQACVVCGHAPADHEGDGQMLHDFVQQDDQCPITSRRCDRPCGTECIRGMFAAAAADQPSEEADGLPNIRSITADTVCECEHDRGQHDDLGNCWHMDSAGDEDCDCDQFRRPAPSAGQDTERLRDEIETWLYVHSDDSQPDLLSSALFDGPLRQLIAERDRTYRCCPHCKDDAIHDVPENGHDLPCNLCQRDETIARLIAERDEARAQVQRVRELADEFDRPVEGLTGPGGPMRALFGGGDVCFRIRRALDTP